MTHASSTFPLAWDEKAELGGHIRHPSSPSKVLPKPSQMKLKRQSVRVYSVNLGQLAMKMRKEAYPLEDPEN